MRVTHAVLTVTDQDAAQRFYLDVLGFVAQSDHRGDGYRWLSVAAPGDALGIELVLAAAGQAELAAMAARHRAGTPAMAFTIDGHDELERIRRAGAQVLSEPRRQDYGGTDALIDDTVGNIICLHQD